MLMFLLDQHGFSLPYLPKVFRQTGLDIQRADPDQTQQNIGI